MMFRSQSWNRYLPHSLFCPEYTYYPSAEIFLLMKVYLKRLDSEESPIYKISHIQALKILTIFDSDFDFNHMFPLYSVSEPCQHILIYIWKSKVLIHGKGQQCWNRSYWHANLIVTVSRLAHLTGWRTWEHVSNLLVLPYLSVCNSWTNK